MESEDNFDTPVQGVPAVESVGTRLRAAREKAGLTIQDIAERTRVPARHLHAIEEDRHGSRTEGGVHYEGLPALAYSAGFVKAFAEIVGLNGKELSAQFRQEAEPDTLPYYDQHEPLDPARVPSAGMAWIAAAVGAVIVAILIAFSMGVFSGSGEQPVTNETPPPVSQIPPPEDGAAATEPAPSESRHPATNPAAAVASNAAGPVVMTATEDAWIKVYDRSGQTVRMGILTVGENYTVPGDPNQLLLWTGKAGAIRITVGGKPVAPLGKPVQTVRDVSLSPASLLARQAPGVPPASTSPTVPAAPVAPAVPATPRG